MGVFPICSHIRLKTVLIGSTERHNRYEERKSRKGLARDMFLPYSTVFTEVNNNFGLLSDGRLAGHD